MKSPKLLSTLLFFILFFSFSLSAQNRFEIKGTVMDTLQEVLPSATVVLMNQADSVIANFGLTDNNGAFFIKKVESGAYILQITYIGYENYVQNLDLKQDIDLGQIKLQAAITNLETATVTSEHIPVRMNSDTIEYNANAFKVQPGSAVEDLLKKLPGVEVDRAGNIRAQGEQVQQVFVDGKEFFGNDPQIATKNLPADAVDKVQVFDKKSDLAEFSGIDDGNETKAINLELKEDKKKGYFGKVEAGYGTDERYNGKFNINRFGGASQISVLGMMNNVNEQGFSLNDYLNFMGGLNNLMSGGGGSMRLSIGSDEIGGLPLGMNGRDGLTTTWAGGLNVNHDFSKKTKLNASYFYSKMENVIDRVVNQQNLLTNQSFYLSDENALETLKNDNHRLNLTVRHKIDSAQNLIFRTNLGYNESNNIRLEDNRTFNPEGLLENSGLSDYLSNGERFYLNSNLTYRRRFSKIGRIMVANASLRQNINDANANLNAINHFPIEATSDTIAQRQIQDEQSSNWGARLSYTEPLGKGKYLELNYARQNYKNRSKKDFYDRMEQQEIFNETLSRNFQQDYIYNRSGMNFRWNKKNLKFTTGVHWQHSQLKGLLVSEQMELSKPFSNWLPSMRLNYEMGSANSLNFSYRTSVQEPSLQQLQPIVDNSNPLRLYEGNPDLEVEYAHNVDLGYTLIDQFSFTNFFVNMRAVYTKNKITNAQTIDEQFRQILKPVNVANDWRGDAYLSFSTPLRFIKSQIDINPRFNYNRGIVFVNELENIYNRLTSEMDVSIGNRKKEKFDLIVGANWEYTQSTYSESSAFNQDFLNQTYYTDLSFDFAKTWAFNSIFDYNIYGNTSFGSAEKVPLWKATLTKYLFKSRGQLSFTVHDILNQNLGVNRTSNLSYIREERVQSLGRYFMLSFGWSLSGFGENGGGLDMQINRRR